MAVTKNNNHPTQLEYEWFRERERAASWLRLGFAIIGIVVIQLNPSRVARYPALSTIVLVSFLIYSVGAVWFAAKNRFPSNSLGAITTALDTIWIAFIVLSTGGTRTPFFFYYSFPVITASLRWGLKGSLPVAGIGVAIYAAIRLTLAAEAISEPIGIDTLVVRSFYLLALAGIFGYISEFEQRQNRKLLAFSRTAGQLAALQERQRIMYDLHDGLLQSLATLILRIESYRARSGETAKELTGELGQMEDMTRNTMNEIRQFLAGKEPAPIAPSTLMEKLKVELRFLQELGIEVWLEADPDDLDLPPETERELYYVLREALTNITRHAHATRVEVQLLLKKDHVDGLVEDNGVGVDISHDFHGNRVGMASMRDRIEKSGGRLEIQSSPGNGFKIVFSVPLNSPNRLAVNQ
jgi:signal transduction histidine kinase